jgi:hypothetical protein
MINDENVILSHALTRTYTHMIQMSIAGHLWGELGRFLSPSGLDDADAGSISEYEEQMLHLRKFSLEDQLGDQDPELLQKMLQQQFNFEEQQRLLPLQQEQQLQPWLLGPQQTPAPQRALAGWEVSLSLSLYLSLSLSLQMLESFHTTRSPASPP